MKLKNRQEHTSCLFYSTEETALFRQYMIAEGQAIEPHNRSEGIILYIKEGDVCLIKDGKPVNHIRKENMVFVPQDDKCFIRATTAAYIITCALSLHLPLCARYSFSNLIQDYEAEGSILRSPPQQHSNPSIKANQRINDFFTNVDETLSDGLSGIPYHELKRQEFLILLRAYYSKEDLFSLFKALFRQTSEFKQFIMKNYKNVADVNEFASMANMSVRSFQRRFKSEFDCSLREWLLERKSEQVLHELKSSDRSLIDIATDFGFSAMSYFTTFCKNNLGKTPSELRAQKDPNSLNSSQKQTYV